MALAQLYNPLLASQHLNSQNRGLSELRKTLEVRDGLGQLLTLGMMKPRLKEMRALACGHTAHVC